MTKYHFTKVSSNTKTGPIPVTTTSSNTCPDTCSFKDTGCYAKYSNLGRHWKYVSEGKRGDDLESLVMNIRQNIYKGQLWRHNQAGDLPGENNKIDHQALAAIVDANAGKKGFTYTHKPVGYSGQELVNARAVYAANKSGFTINLSADNLKEADRLAGMGIGPVVVVLPEDSPNQLKTPEGRHVFVCPAQLRDEIACANCGICQVSSRKGIVGFKAHGIARKKVSLKVVQ